MKRLFPLAVALCVTLPLFAANLGKYDNWASSPQGYFLTQDERKQWEGLTSEAAAAKFVEEFLAKRDPGFAAEIAKRAEMADKYLSLSGRSGSQTLRGKVIILFGPPASMDVSTRAKTNAKHDNPMMAGALSNVGSIGSGGRTDDATPPTGSSIGTSTGIRTYTITYTGDALARTIDRTSATFVIEADAGTGADQFATKSGAKEAGEYFERAARASIVKK